MEDGVRKPSQEVLSDPERRVTGAQLCPRAGGGRRGLWVTQVGRERSPHHKARGHFVDTLENFTIPLSPWTFQELGWNDTQPKLHLALEILCLNNDNTNYMNLNQTLKYAKTA